MRYEENADSVVLSLHVDVYLTRPNEIALRFHQARAGSLPFPLKTVLDEVTRFTHEAGIPLQWTQVEGDPTAIVFIAPSPDKHKNVLTLEALELHEGEVYVSGRTAPASGPRDPDSGVAEEQLKKEKVQR